MMPLPPIIFRDKSSEYFTGAKPMHIYSNGNVLIGSPDRCTDDAHTNDPKWQEDYQAALCLVNSEEFKRGEK
jgi:hypothetical protein